MSAFLNRFCTSIAPYQGAPCFSSPVGTTDLLRSTGVAFSAHSDRAGFNPPLRSSLSDYPEASWLQHSSLHDHRRPSSLFPARSSRRTVRVHKRSPTLANHAFHCSQVASRAITVAVCGRSGCSSRLHSGYSSNLLQIPRFCSSRSCRPS